MPFAKVEGKTLHYTDHPRHDQSTPSASQAAPLTIIFVHGLGSTQNFYQPILGYFTNFARCITFDNYAAGRSKYLSELYPDTSIPAIAQDVLGLMDYLKIDKAVLVGYSMGGMVPTTVAGMKPDRVIGAVLVGPVHPTPEVAAIFTKRIQTVREGGIETMANTIPYGATGPNTTPLQKSFIREMIMSQDPEGYCANCKAIETAKPPAYEKVSCPVLIVSGEVDKSAPVSGCQHIKEQIEEKAGNKNVSIEVVKGMGHWYCVEDGDLIGKMIAGWCEKLT